MKALLPALCLAIALGCGSRDSNKPAPPPSGKAPPAKEEPKPDPGPTNEERRKTTSDRISRITAGCRDYDCDYGKYPDELKELLTRGPKNLPYYEGDLKDGWGNEFSYVVNRSNAGRPGAHNKYTFDLMSYGADGKPGGEGDNADICNW